MLEFVPILGVRECALCSPRSGLVRTLPSPGQPPFRSPACAERHRRYASGEVERILRVVAERERGVALPVAIERARLAPAGVPSLFAQLRERRPDLQPMTVRKLHLTPLARAIEEESARAERALALELRMKGERGA